MSDARSPVAIQSGLLLRAFGPRPFLSRIPVNERNAEYRGGGLLKGYGIGPWREIARGSFVWHHHFL